uniref:3-hydroxy-3-methylglutaryl-coenzyme A reductase 2 (Trinotate prediction) n=1 Tax=Myxobolus squamalis TaxID=59785 RepID=A0A6B2G1M7_MYXSQ
MSFENLDKCENEEIVAFLISNSIAVYNLEKHLSDHERCVLIRRKYFEKVAGVLISENLSYKNYDYEKVYNRCCENVVGYVGIPVGLCGPILLNGEQYYVPLATTEGCLVASTTRGASCISDCGIKGVLVEDGMTRAPVICTDSVDTAL